MYFLAAHAVRHASADNRSDGRPGNGDRLDAQLIESFDDMQMRNAPRSATAESDGNAGRGWHGIIQHFILLRRLRL